MPDPSTPDGTQTPAQIPLRIQSPPPVGKLTFGQPDWSPWEADGMVPSKDFAALLGVSLATLTKYAQKEMIPRAVLTGPNWAKYALDDVKEVWNLRQVRIAQGYVRPGQSRHTHGLTGERSPAQIAAEHRAWEADLPRLDAKGRPDAAGHTDADNQPDAGSRTDEWATDTALLEADGALIQGGATLEPVRIGPVAGGGVESMPEPLPDHGVSELTLEEFELFLGVRLQRSLEPVQQELELARGQMRDMAESFQLVLKSQEALARNNEDLLRSNGELMSSHRDLVNSQNSLTEALRQSMERERRYQEQQARRDDEHKELIQQQKDLAAQMARLANATEERSAKDNQQRVEDEKRRLSEEQRLAEAAMLLPQNPPTFWDRFLGRAQSASPPKRPS